MIDLIVLNCYVALSLAHFGAVRVEHKREMRKFRGSHSKCGIKV